MSTSSKSHQLIFCLIVFLGLCFRIILVHHGPFKAGDSIDYDRLGINLSLGNGFSSAPEKPFLPEIIRDPLYPFFLAAIYSLFGHHPLAVMLFQVVLDTIGCLLIFLLLRRIMNHAFSLSVLAMMSFYPFSAYYCASLLSETLSTFLLSVSFFLWILCIRNKESDGSPILLILLGVTLGLNILCKSALILLPLLFAAVFVFPKRNMRSLKKSFLILTSCYLLVLPWTLRNALVFGKFIPVRVGIGQALWVGTVERGGGIVTESKIDEGMEVLYRKFLETKETGNAIEYDRLLKEAALNKIKRAPLSFLSRSIRNTFRIWMSMYHHEMNPYLIYGARIGSMAVLILAIWGFFSSYSLWNRLYPFIWIIAYFSIIHALLHIEARYSMPARPYLLVFTCLGLFKLMRSKYSRQ